MRYPSLLLALSAAFTVLSAPLAYASAPYWQWRNPTPQGNDFYDVAYGGGVRVALCGRVCGSSAVANTSNSFALVASMSARKSLV